MPAGGLALGPCCCGGSAAGACACDACGRALADVLTATMFCVNIGRDIHYPMACMASQGRPNTWLYQANPGPTSRLEIWMMCSGGIVYLKEVQYSGAFLHTILDTGWYPAATVDCGARFSATWTGFPEMFCDIFDGHHPTDITVSEPLP